MARSRTLTVDLYDPNDREIEVEVNFSKGCDDYFSKSFGNWLPGDPDEIEIDSACWADTRVQLTDAEFAELVLQSEVEERVYDLLKSEDESYD